MRSKSTVKRDKHGLYVRVDSHLYRPVKTIDSYPLASWANSRELGDTSFCEGTSVSLRHLPATPFCSVTDAVLTEHWHSHGVYVGKKSEQCWCPAPDMPTPWSAPAPRV